MEKSIPHDVELEVLEIVGRIACAGQHMVPLEDLVQYDPVEEAAETEAEKDSGNGRKAFSVICVSFIQI
jgi:hypothetical protein